MRMRRGIVLSRMSVSSSVCLCVCNALTLETLDLDYWYACTSSEYLGQVRSSRSSGGQGHSRKPSVRPLRGWPIEGNLIVLYYI